MIHFITDSTADFPKEWQEKYNFHIMPMKFDINGKTYLDGVDITKAEFYKLVSASSKTPATSCPSPGDWSKMIKEIASPNDTVITFHLSSQLSGSYNSAAVAAKDLAGEYNVVPYDTVGGSSYVGYLLKEAREMEQEGKPLNEIMKRMNTIRDQVTICFSLDTVKFAISSGRYEGIGQVIASVIKIKPIVFFQHEGKMQIRGISRTLNKAMSRLVDTVHSKYGDVPLNVSVMYANVLSNGEKFMEVVKDKLNINEIFLVDINLTLASHIGPGCRWFDRLSRLKAKQAPISKI